MDTTGTGEKPQPENSGPTLHFEGDLVAAPATFRRVSFGGFGPKPALSFTLFRDFEPNPQKNWLVQDILGAGELSSWFGPPGSSKSLITMDLAFFIAAQKMWFDRHTMKGAVLCVLAERLGVSQRRLAALGKHHGYDDIPLAVVGGPADLRTNRKHARLIIDYAKRLCDLSGLPFIYLLLKLSAVFWLVVTRTILRTWAP